MKQFIGIPNVGPLNENVEHFQTSEMLNCFDAFYNRTLGIHRNHPTKLYALLVNEIHKKLLHKKNLKLLEKKLLTVSSGKMRFAMPSYKMHRCIFESNFFARCVII